MFGARNELNPYIDVTQTAINELANRPRQDITGERYGNTLSDDMFAIKNPSLPNRHTPESYEYFNQVAPEVNTQTWEPAAGWNPLPVLNDDFVSRRKFIGDGSPFALAANKEWGLTDDILEFPDNYTQEQIDFATALRNKKWNNQRINDLSTEGLRSEQMGYAPEEQSPYLDAEYDPYLGINVNYGAMSPETMEQLAKMGVNRPKISDETSLRLEENGNDTYNSLLELYRLAIENGWR